MILIVGAGLTGCVLARELAERGKEVHVLERRACVGGNVREETSKNGVEFHAWGCHAFHTKSKRVWDYLNAFVKFRPYEHRVWGVSEGQTFPIPFNLMSLRTLLPNKIFERELLSEFGDRPEVSIRQLKDSPNRTVRQLGGYIFRTVYEGYSRKMWELPPEFVEKAIARVKVRLNEDDRYHLDPYQGIPVGGYNTLVTRLLDHALIKVKHASWEASKGSYDHADHTYFTGPIDEYFKHRRSPLPYRSIEFRYSEQKCQPIQRVAQYNYTQQKIPYTRSIEHRLMTGQESEYSLRSVEKPCVYIPGINEPLYPMPTDDANALYEKYAEDAKKLPNVTFCGRLGRYKYYDMDQAVANALSLV